MSSLDGALCVGEHELFDSRDGNDHQLAAAICASCPVLEACRDRLDETLNAAYSTYGPTGTWAGRFFGHPIAICGTVGGYARHVKTLKEDPCGDCRRAKNEHALAREHAKAAAAGRPIKKRVKTVVCGTDSGYYAHLRTKGEEACDDCKEAHQLAQGGAAVRQQSSIDEAVVERVVNGGTKPRLLTNAEARECVTRLRAMGYSGTRISREFGFKAYRYPAPVDSQGTTSHEGANAATLEVDEDEVA